VEEMYRDNQEARIELKGLENSSQQKLAFN
jgi:hypothetical protein